MLKTIIKYTIIISILVLAVLFVQVCSGDYEGQSVEEGAVCTESLYDKITK